MPGPEKPGGPLTRPVLNKTTIFRVQRAPIYRSAPLASAMPTSDWSRQPWETPARPFDAATRRGFNDSSTQTWT